MEYRHGENTHHRTRSLCIDCPTVSGIAGFSSRSPNESHCIFGYSDYNQLPMIVFKVDNVWYLAVEMAALMGNGTMSPETVSSIFAELCSFPSPFPPIHRPQRRSS